MSFCLCCILRGMNAFALYRGVVRHRKLSQPISRERQGVLIGTVRLRMGGSRLNEEGLLECLPIRRVKTATRNRSKARTQNGL